MLQFLFVLTAYFLQWITSDVKIYSLGANPLIPKKQFAIISFSSHFLNNISVINNIIYENIKIIIWTENEPKWINNLVIFSNEIFESLYY